MRGDVIHPRNYAKGCARQWLVRDGGSTCLYPGTTGAVALPGHWDAHSGWQYNDLMYASASIIGELLRGAPDGKAYKLGAMYVEYENNSGLPVSVEAVSREDGLDYYGNLQLTANRDYLRVAMTAHTFTSTDDELFPRKNKLTFFARTSGVSGVHGKTFGDSVSSRVYALALVATPDFADASQDLAYSRLWFAEDDQLVKLASAQIGLEYPVTYN